ALLPERPQAGKLQARTAGDQRDHFAQRRSHILIVVEYEGARVVRGLAGRASAAHQQAPLWAGTSTASGLTRPRAAGRAGEPRRVAVEPCAIGRACASASIGVNTPHAHLGGTGAEEPPY